MRARRAGGARITGVSVRAAVLGGGAAGFTAGLFAGCALGALLAWLAGAALDWQRHLAFTLGVTEDLLPLGEQTGLLEAMRDSWWLVVPLTGLLLGLPAAMAGGLGAGLVVALFNRFGRGLAVDLEEAEEAPPRPAARRVESISSRL